MKRINNLTSINSGDYIKARHNKEFIVFKVLQSVNYLTYANAIILDTNIESLKELIGKEEYFNRNFYKSFKFYRLNKFESWLYML